MITRNVRPGGGSGGGCGGGKLFLSQCLLGWGQVYTDVALSETVTETIRSGMGELPLLLKIGVFPDTTLQRVLRTVSGSARDHLGERHRARGARRWPAGFEQYLRAGVLGRIIHEPCERFARRVR